MAVPGEVIVNVKTGEKIIFEKTAKDTNGALLQFQMVVHKGQTIVPHIHPVETETIEVHSGQMKVSINNVEQIVNPGEKAVIPAGSHHVWWNIGDGDLNFTEKLEPSLNWEELFETMYGLAKDGKADKSGIPSLPQIALSLTTFPHHVWFYGPPIFLQKIAFVILAFVARLQGLKPTYPQYIQH